MVLKIDGYDIACAAYNSREMKYPSNRFNEIGFLSKVDMKRIVDNFQRRNCVATLPFSGNVITDSNKYTAKFKETKMFFAKTFEEKIGQVTIALDNQQFSFFAGNPKRVFLFVGEGYIPVFNNMLFNNEQEVIDLAQFIRINNVFVHNFILSL